jgi:hypothetical protein
MPVDNNPDNEASPHESYPQIFTRDGDAILVALPLHLVDQLGVFAKVVATTVQDSAAPGYDRICSPVDPTVLDDDPLARLERQCAVTGVSDVMLASLHSTSLTVEEAEAWLRVLTMFAAVFASVVGVETDEDRAVLGEGPSYILGLLQVLQCSLVQALDPESFAADEEYYKSVKDE